MAKRPFIRKQKRKRHGTAFWDHEYTEGGHLKLSLDVSEDLEKFTRWLIRQEGQATLNEQSSVFDVGCGNGRNLMYLYEQFKMKGSGIDNSSAAITAARKLAGTRPLTYDTRSMAGNLPTEDNSHDIVLDMMASHFLSEAERAHLREEIYRILKPGGWLFMKTHLRDGDLHSKRLLADHPAKEDGSYIHPVMGVPEHVYSEAELKEFLEGRFVIHKIYRSHKHISRGKARKRRTIAMYAQKDPYQK